MDPMQMQAMIAHLLMNPQNGTVTRGPQDFGEYAQDALHGLGLPAGISQTETEAYPMGVAAVGRGMAGTPPQMHINQAFQALKERQR